MSPSEADLRAALRDGEGDGVDPYDIIYAVRQTRARRRTMLLSAAAAVVVVGGVAAGVSALGSGDNQSGGGNIAAGNARSAAGPMGRANLSNRPAPPVHPVRVEPGIEFSTACRTPVSPATRTHQPAPGASSLLAGPVKEFVVCAYANVAPQTTASSQPVVVTGPAAASLARSLRAASETAMPQSCPMVTSTGNIALRLIPIAPDGRHLPSLIATVGLPACASNVSNGVVLRYGWRLPPDVRALLHLSTIEPGPLRLTPVNRHPTGVPPR